MPYEHLGEALATDYFFVHDQLSAEEWRHFLRTGEFVDEELLPRSTSTGSAREPAWPLFRRLGEIGIVGDDITGIGAFR